MVVCSSHCYRLSIIQLIVHGTHDQLPMYHVFFPPEIYLFFVASQSYYTVCAWFSRLAAGEKFSRLYLDASTCQAGRIRITIWSLLLTVSSHPLPRWFG
jgi:hypothetical protein